MISPVARPVPRAVRLTWSPESAVHLRALVRPAIIRPAESLRNRPQDRPCENDEGEAYSEHESRAAEGFFSRGPRGLVESAVFHRSLRHENSPMKRPSTATNVQRTMDTTPTTLPQTGPTLASSAMVTLCRSVKVKINATRRSRIFIQKNGL